MMLSRLKLTHAILLLVSVFLVAQVFLFARMEALLVESENDFRQAMQAKEFVDVIREFNEALFRFAKERHKTRGQTVEERVKMSGDACVTLKTLLRYAKKMKRLATNDKVRFDVDEAQQGLTNALQIIEPLAVKYKDPSYDWPKSERERFRDQLARAQNASRLDKELQEAMKQRFEDHLVKRAETKVLLFFSLFVVAAGTVLLALFLLRHINSRLNIIQNNFYRLAAGVPLNPVLGGSDELSELDATFHSIARQLNLAKRKEQSLLNKSVSLICSIDRAGRYTAANAASEAILGYSPDDLIGTHYVEHIAQEDAESVREHLHKTTAGQLPPPFEATMINKNGSTVDTLWSVKVNASDPILCVIHDVTDKKQAGRMRKDLVALITAELQKPLQSIRSFLDDLSKEKYGSQTDKGKNLVSLAMRSSGRMANLVNDLLDAEKIDSGGIVLNIADVSVSDVLETSVAPLQSWAGERGITVECISTSDARIRADEERIGRVLTNLISNAIKFSPKESKITVDVKDSGSGSSFIEFHVIDEGRGISPDVIDTLFERFKQAKSEDRRVGTGLGLAICKDIVELHGGTLSVTSQEGKGSVFRFTVPRAG